MCMLMANKAVKSLKTQLLTFLLSNSCSRVRADRIPAPVRFLPYVRLNSASVIKKGFNFLCPEDLFVGAFKPPWLPPPSIAPLNLATPQFCLTFTSNIFLIFEIYFLIEQRGLKSLTNKTKSLLDVMTFNMHGSFTCIERQTEADTHTTVHWHKR